MMKKSFKTIYKYWMLFAKKLALIPTTIILFIIYFGVIGMISVIHFIFRKDILDKRFADNKNSFWLDKEHIAVDFERCRKQF